MPTPVHCPQCAAAYTIPDNLPRRAVRCRSCQTPFEVGQAAPSTVATAVVPLDAAELSATAAPSSGQRFRAALGSGAQVVGAGVVSGSRLLAGGVQTGFWKLHALGTGERRKLYLPIILGGTACTLLLVIGGGLWAWSALTSRDGQARANALMPADGNRGPTNAAGVQASTPAPAGQTYRQQLLTYRQATVAEAYDRHGKKNPKWDAAAREALQVSLPIWDHPIQSDDWHDRAHAATRKAIDLGCDDPLVVYWWARLLYAEHLRPYPERVRMYRQAANAIRDSRYPPIRKAICCAVTAMGITQLGTGLTPADRKEVERYLADAFALLPELLRDPSIPRAEMNELCMQLVEAYRGLNNGDRLPGVHRVVEALEKSDPALALYVKGKWYVKAAWDARSSAWASQVTPAQWRGFTERLAVAEEALEKSWQLKPCPFVATDMLLVELGQGQGRDRMEMWFKRALELNPGNRDACAHKLTYLEPKWHGSAQEALQHGRELLRGGNWDAELSMILLDAHVRLANYAPTHYQQPEVWADVRAVLEPRLQAKPELRFERSQLALFAFRCGQLAEAHRQFELLGTNYSRAAFPDPGQYQQMRNAARARAKTS